MKCKIFQKCDTGILIPVISGDIFGSPELFFFKNVENVESIFQR
jgi:hypothetical protein